MKGFLERSSNEFSVPWQVREYGPTPFFCVDWLVWETLEYNLPALTCSLKKALSTGIRLSWQGQLRLALTVSLYVSLSLCFCCRPFDQFFPICVYSTWCEVRHRRSFQAPVNADHAVKHGRLTQIKYHIPDIIVQCPPPVLQN